METQKGSHEKQLAELEDELKAKLNTPGSEETFAEIMKRVNAFPVLEQPKPKPKNQQWTVVSNF